MKKVSTSILIISLFASCALSQDFKQKDSISVQTETQKNFQRHSIGSTFFMLFNVLPDPPSFYQLNYGYYLTPKDVIIVEAITWTYTEPIGIPYGAIGEHYPGKIRDFGIGVGYQRFHWKNLYTTVQATPFLQNYIDSEGDRIQSGLQLFLQLRRIIRIQSTNLIGMDKVL